MSKERVIIKKTIKKTAKEKPSQIKRINRLRLAKYLPSNQTQFS